MFIKIQKVTRLFERKYKSGETASYNRSTNFVLLKCDNCGSLFERQVGNTIDRRRCNNNFSHYCSNCPTYVLAAKKGQITQKENNLQKVGKKTITSHGYISIYVGETHASRNVRSGSIFEHIYVMEQRLGRSLEKGEVIHHINGDKQDNRPENLDCMSIQQHNNCHGKIEKILFDFYKKGYIRYNRETKLYECNASSFSV